MYCFRSFQRKFTVVLVGYSVVAAAAVIWLIGTALSTSLRRQFFDFYRGNGQGIAEHLATDLLVAQQQATPEAAQHLVDSVSLSGVARMVIQDSRGQAVYDSQSGQPWPELAGPPALFVDLHHRAEKSAVRWQMQPYRGVMELRAVVHLSGQESWLLVSLLLDDRAVASQVRQQVLQISLLVILLVLVAVYLILLLTNALLQPMRNLQGAAEQIAQGNFAARVEIRSADEVGQIASTFNQMAERVERGYQLLQVEAAHRTVELERAWTALEEEVARRTAQLTETKRSLETACDSRTQELAMAKAALEAKMVEMEKINSFLVNREVAMAELKEKVAKLQTELVGHRRSGEQLLS